MQPTQRASEEADVRQARSTLIRDARHRQNLSQAKTVQFVNALLQASGASTISRDALASIEVCRRGIDESELRAIAGALGIGEFQLRYPLVSVEDAA